MEQNNSSMVLFPMDNSFDFGDALKLPDQLDTVLPLQKVPENAFVGSAELFAFDDPESRPDMPYCSFSNPPWNENDVSNSQQPEVEMNDFQSTTCKKQHIRFGSIRKAGC